MKKYITPGLILILAGTFFLLEALPGINLPNGMFFVLLGVALLVGRVCTKKYGLSIAGFITLCLGGGFVCRDLLNLGGQYVMVTTPISLALAFFLIHICEYRRLGNWPIVPALVLMSVGVLSFLMITPQLHALLKPYYGTIFPIILIIVGISLLVRGSVRQKRVKHQTDYDVPPMQDTARAQDPSTWAQPPIRDRQADPAGASAAQEPVTEPYTVVPPASEPVITAEYTYTEPASETDDENKKKNEGEAQ